MLCCVTVPASARFASQAASINASTKSTLKPLLPGLASLSLAMAAPSFWVGGRAISEFAKMERQRWRASAKQCCSGLEAITRDVADGFEESGENGRLISEGKFVRK